MSVIQNLLGRRRDLWSGTNALMIMLAFGTIVVSLVALIVTMMKLILDNTKISRPIYFSTRMDDLFFKLTENQPS